MGNYFRAAFNDLLFQKGSFLQPLVYFCVFKILLLHSGIEMTFPLDEIKKDNSFLSEGPQNMPYWIAGL